MAWICRSVPAVTCVVVTEACPQEFLDYPDVGVDFEEVCGERVPQDRGFAG